jgi:RimJ/RimL family protein N-acetyltransferase
VIPLETPRIILRNWEERDRDVYYELMSDDKVMEFFSYRRTCEEADVRRALSEARIAEIGFGFYAVELKDTGACIGMCGIAELDLKPLFPPATLEVGWRFTKRHWGKGYATESAKAAIADGFLNHGHSGFVAIAVNSNHRSIAVMERIGMVRDPDGDFDHPDVPANQPSLVPFTTYRLSRNQWSEALSK